MVWLRVFFTIIWARAAKPLFTVAYIIKKAQAAAVFTGYYCFSTGFVCNNVPGNHYVDLQKLLSLQIVSAAKLYISGGYAGCHAYMYTVGYPDI
jgi:hypothetical protein